MERSHVALLTPEVARRIAAGEVIERPASVVRELIDNSLDARATEIDIAWEAGGTQLLRVHDNGHGMEKEDLELCWKPHATSKIRTLETLTTPHPSAFGARRWEASRRSVILSSTPPLTDRHGDTSFVFERGSLIHSIPPHPPPVQRSPYVVCSRTSPHGASSSHAHRARVRRSDPRSPIRRCPFPRFASPIAPVAPRVSSPPVGNRTGGDRLRGEGPPQSLFTVQGSGEGFLRLGRRGTIDRTARSSPYSNVRKSTANLGVQVDASDRVRLPRRTTWGLFPAAALFLTIDPPSSTLTFTPLSARRASARLERSTTAS